MGTQHYIRVIFLICLAFPLICYSPHSTISTVSEAALLNLMLLTSDLYASVFDVIRIGLHLTGYFYAAFAMICFGIVLYEAGPSPTESSSNVTPKDIEFRSPEGEGFADSFAASTEHAGNLTNRLEGTLA